MKKAFRTSASCSGTSPGPSSTRERPSRCAARKHAARTGRSPRVRWSDSSLRVARAADRHRLVRRTTRFARAASRNLLARQDTTQFNPTSRSGELTTERVRLAIHLTFEGRGTHVLPPELSLPPSDWRIQFETLAEQCNYRRTWTKCSGMWGSSSTESSPGICRVGSTGVNGKDLRKPDENGRAHRVPLTGWAKSYWSAEVAARLSCLRVSKPRATQSLLPAVFSPKAASGYRHFTQHDVLRKASKPHCSSRTRRYVAEKLLNHTD